MTPVFSHGALRLYLLSLLAAKPRHGYELIQALADRFAEAFAERMHEYVRRELWCYAPDEAFTPEQLLGCLDAVGQARERIGRNVAPLLALEAMCLSLRLPR